MKKLLVLLCLLFSAPAFASTVFFTTAGSNIPLTFPSGATWFSVWMLGGGGGGYNSTDTSLGAAYWGGGGGFEFVETPVPSQSGSIFSGSGSVCVYVGLGGGVGASGQATTVTGFSGANCTGTTQTFFQATGGDGNTGSNTGLSGASDSGYNSTINKTIPISGAMVNEWGNRIQVNTSAPQNVIVPGMSSSIAQSNEYQFGYGEVVGQAGYSGLAVVSFY